MHQFQNDPVIQPDKGIKGGSCNVTACQAPNSAMYYNKSTRKYYCKACADAINRANMFDCYQLYGTYHLCQLDEDTDPRIKEHGAGYHHYQKEDIAQKDELYNFDIECAPCAYEEPPQRTYSGPPIKGKKGRDKRW